MANNDRPIKFPTTCHPDTIALYEYWRTKCGERRMPARSDIDPVEMPRQLLPESAL